MKIQVRKTNTKVMCDEANTVGLCWKCDYCHTCGATELLYQPERNGDLESDLVKLFVEDLPRRRWMRRRANARAILKIEQAASELRERTRF